MSDRPSVEQQQLERTLFDRLLDSSSAAARYPSNEMPLAGTRVDLLEGLLQVAREAGLEGTLVVRSHVGQFCMSQLSSGELFATPDHEPIENCTVIGQNEQAALRKSERRSKAFRELLDLNESLVGNSIAIDVVPMGTSEPLLEYPDVDELDSAGEWNRVARQNNRLEFSFTPD